MSYSQDLKQCVIDYCQLGHSKEEASRIFKVSLRSIFRWLKYKDIHGDLVPLVRKEHKGRKINKSEFIAYLNSHDDMTLAEYASVFNVNPSSIFYACKRYNITRKKSHRLL